MKEKKGDLFCLQMTTTIEPFWCTDVKWKEIMSVYLIKQCDG